MPVDWRIEVAEQLHCGGNVGVNGRHTSATGGTQPTLTTYYDMTFALQPPAAEET